MTRTAIYSALVLRCRPSGESNSEVTFLTSEEGVMKATVFGGPKSKLRAHSAQYNSGQAWIYHDPVKDYRKLSDFDVHSWRPGLRELYDRTMTAGGIAETILSTHGGGGDWGIAMKLAMETLDALDNANEELCPRLLVHFLWRWAGFLGIRPQIDCCSSCGNALVDSQFWFSSRENTVLCGNCVSGEGYGESSVPSVKLCPQRQALSPKKPSSVPRNNLLQIHPGCRLWLVATETVEPASLRRYSLDNKSLFEAKALTTTIMTEALGKRLVSWEMN